MTKRIRSLSSGKRSIMALSIIAAIATSLYVALKIIPSSRNGNMAEPIAQTTSNTPSAQSSYSDGEYREPGNTVHENQGEASVSDTGGRASSNTSEPKTSSTGEITVYLPIANSVITSGQEISGISTLPRVHYRIIDNVTGVVASGSLEVVNGRFSGILNFSNAAQEGRVDIFATKSDFTEYSNVEIPVRFE